MPAGADQYVSRVPRRTGIGNMWLWVVLELAVLVVVVALLRFTWVGYLIAGAVVVVVAALLVPINGRPVISWLRLRAAFGRRRRAKVTDTDVPTDLVPLAEWVPGLTVMRTLTGRGGEIGVITDGSAWVAVLSLVSDDKLLADRGAEIDLDSLGSLTTQDDVAFDGVQLVTFTVPAPTSLLLGEGSPAAASYREILGGDGVPPTVRRTWLCLRLDPRQCLGAVARRGAGNEGINATLRFGLHRAQSMLKRQGIETRALDPVEIYEVLALTSGAGPEHGDRRTNEGWLHWTCDGLEHRGQLVTKWGKDASLGYARLQDAVAHAPALFVITSFTLSQQKEATGAIRVVAPTTAATETAFSHLTGVLGGDIRLQPAGGVQVPALLSTVPFGRGAR